MPNFILCLWTPLETNPPYGKMPEFHRMRTKYFLCHDSYQYVLDFYDFRTIRKRLKCASKWYINHRIPVDHGIKSFDGSPTPWLRHLVMPALQQVWCALWTMHNRYCNMIFKIFGVTSCTIDTLTIRLKSKLKNIPPIVI